MNADDKGIASIKRMVAVWKGKYEHVDTDWWLSMNEDNDECRHGMFPADCTLCNGRVIQDETPTVGPIFRAMYQGYCRYCREQIYPGDDVRYVDDLLMHKECAPT